MGDYFDEWKRNLIDSGWLPESAAQAGGDAVRFDDVPRVQRYLREVGLPFEDTSQERSRLPIDWDWFTSIARQFVMAYDYITEDMKYIANAPPLDEQPIHAYPFFVVMFDELLQRLQDEARAGGVVSENEISSWRW